ncbi:hypothetical protein K3495_g1533 [Podosphaera aphanis]|nr:hypothetical protein K3495_g1533 [Podosphaera aphanis]
MGNEGGFDADNESTSNPRDILHPTHPFQDSHLSLGWLRGVAQCFCSSVREPLQQDRPRRERCDEESVLTLSPRLPVFLIVLAGSSLIETTGTGERTTAR